MRIYDNRRATPTPLASDVRAVGSGHNSPRLSCVGRMVLLAVSTAFPPPPTRVSAIAFIGRRRRCGLGRSRRRCRYLQLVGEL
jgi:hypothetical protein